MNIRLFETVQAMIKYSVFIGAFLMTTHVGLLMAGYDIPVADWICGFSILGFITLFMASYCLRLCNLFRAFLIYDFVVGQCIRVQRELHAFDTILQEARLAVFTAGVILITIFIFNRCSTKRS